MEAAAMKVPIVTTDNPGCNDVVQDGENGCFVDGANENEIAQAIEDFLLNPEKRAEFGENSRQRMLNVFDLSKVSESHKDLYTELLTQRL